jgi:CRISPR-associated endoribonuclease Cas6
MRFKITFTIDSKPQILPLNYKYPVSSWIYKTLAQANKEFTSLLHEHGYSIESGKQFKLFTFSDFQIPKGTWKIVGDRMKIWADSVSLVISFMLPEQTQYFVAGLFKEQHVIIGDEITQVHMQVQNIEAIQTHIPKQEKYTFKWLSPVFMALHEEDKKYPIYISPEHPAYKDLFAQNLIDKYTAHCLQKNEKPKEFSISDIAFKSLHEKPKSVKQTIKAFKKEQTEIRAFKFNFELSASYELIETGINAGFGAANSQGFGCCEVVERKND